MLTPQEVSERAFQKSTLGGYNMRQVDEFLDILTGDYSALFNENAVLKSKMKVLVDKVEEYRSTEEAMRKALLAAQRMADDLVKEAEHKKTELLAQTERDADARRGELTRELEAEEYRLEQARRATAAYVEQVRALHDKQAEYLAQLTELTPPEPKPQAESVEEKASEIDDNVRRLLLKAAEDAAAESRRAKTVEEEPEDLSDTTEFPSVPDKPEDKTEEQPGDDAPTSRIDFGALQFGRDYEIT